MTFQYIISRLKITKASQLNMRAKTQLREEMTMRLKNGKPKNKISAELSKLSGWKKRDVNTVVNEPIRSRKWTEGQLLAEISRRLKGTASENKIAAELAERSGWKRHEIISRVRRLKEAQKWSEAELRAEIRKRLSEGDSASKISTRLVELSGWKKREIVAIIKQVREAEKWNEAQLLAAIREKLKSTRSANKIAEDLERPSGWKKHDILVRLKRLLAAEKWSKARLHEEIRKRIDAGNPANRISSELAEISGWKKWEISRILKMIKELGKDGKDKVDLPIADEPIPAVDPGTIVQASKPRDEFIKWQNDLLSQPNSNLYRVRKWGDPVMVKYGFDVNQVNSTNFQAVGLYNNGNKEFGAISNFIRISHRDVMRLRALQIEDNYVAKNEDWLTQKMNWLCSFRGRIYFYDKPSDHWRSAPYIRWGTLALGGNLVHVLGTEVIEAKLRDGITRKVEMAHLRGFRAADWNRPLDDLLAEGLVHRSFCAYKNNHFGDSPKGIVYSPFYSPQDWQFAGGAKADALYIPVEWLEPKV